MSLESSCKERAREGDAVSLFLYHFNPFATQDGINYLQLFFICFRRDEEWPERRASTTTQFWMSDPDLNKNVCFWDNNVSKKDEEEEEEEESAQRQRLETDLGFMHLACSSPSDGTKITPSSADNSHNLKRKKLSIQEGRYWRRTFEANRRDVTSRTVSEHFPAGGSELWIIGGGKFVPLSRGRASVAQERVRLLRTGAESGEETEGGRVGVGGEGGGGGKGGEEEEEEESSCAFCFAWPLAGESATSQFHNLAKRDGVLEASRSDEEVRTKADTRHGKAEQSDRIQQEREKNKRMHRRTKRTEDVALDDEIASCETIRGAAEAAGPSLTRTHRSRSHPPPPRDAQLSNVRTITESPGGGIPPELQETNSPQEGIFLQDSKSTCRRIAEATAELSIA
ncbi:hypothetical protein GEV33_009338 [Tenebrio molitor]|uniref:Uncharacterized protein n=1 Tax=Tenebrio molitor TaxID=7067 RepID=A0A8J6HGX7_TENMO|nr:hypothetical protein GEV33_009338 [Tenebrio molitor]